MIEGYVTAMRLPQICHLSSLVRHRDKHHAPHRGQEREFQTLFDLLFAPRNPRNLGKGAREKRLPEIIPNKAGVCPQKPDRIFGN
ncbi:MAG: hypothetical protein RLZZ253_858 [Verrucomicrobiota bacterium]|jgi:hypothetical protein